VDAGAEGIAQALAQEREEQAKGAAEQSKAARHCGWLLAKMDILCHGLGQPLLSRSLPVASYPAPCAAFTVFKKTFYSIHHIRYYFKPIIYKIF
jgi:hypothetical protein